MIRRNGIIGMIPIKTPSELPRASALGWPCSRASCLALCLIEPKIDTTVSLRWHRKKAHLSARAWNSIKLKIAGAPSRSLTCDPPLRRRTLYPAELPRCGRDSTRIQQARINMIRKFSSGRYRRVPIDLWFRFLPGCWSLAALKPGAFRRFAQNEPPGRLKRWLSMWLPLSSRWIHQQTKSPLPDMKFFSVINPAVCKTVKHWLFRHWLSSTAELLNRLLFAPKPIRILLKSRKTLFEITIHWWWRHRDSQVWWHDWCRDEKAEANINAVGKGQFGFRVNASK